MPTSSSASRPRAMDLSPRRASAVPVAPAAPAGHAAALHSRAKPAHVIDLRNSGAGQSAHNSTVDHNPNHTAAAAPASTTQEHRAARFTDRFDRAKRFGRSEHITKFGQVDSDHMYDQFGNKTLEALVAKPTATGATTMQHHVEHHANLTPDAELPHLTATQHEAMAQLAQPTPQPTPQPILKHTAPNLAPNAGRVLAVATAVTIMSGYVWLQNYPKLAIQSASSRAGISASLPGYLPSSYTLKETKTGAGLVTLNFASPSSPEVLSIAQHRTTWDSSSLLDNHIAQHADDYATVQGQGLTIYLYNNNHAAWVNHGIWYSIEGASRLSREQILKIAYSL